MKRFALWALLALVLLMIAAPLVVAQVPVEPAGDGIQMELSPKEIVWMGATSLGSFLIGLAIKKWPALDSYSNRLIPYTIATIATVGYMVVMKVGFVEALMMAGASSFGAVLLAEGPGKKLTAKPGGGQ